MATISAALSIALQLHQAGRLVEAESVYRQILAVDPNQPDALHLLGLMAHQLGRHEVAVEYIARAIGLKGDAAAFHNNLGEAYRALRHTPEAVACYRRALELEPAYAEAHYNLGNALKDQGELDEAAACYGRALQLKPDFAEAHNNLGSVAAAQGKLDEAVQCYRRALQLKPDFAEAHNNLGSALGQQGKLQEALACYRQAAQLKPDYAEVHYNLGHVLLGLEMLDEALAACHRAVQLKPDYAEAHTKLGVVLHKQGKLEEALAAHRRALALKPELAEAHTNLGIALKQRGYLQEAMACHRRALELKPDFAEAHNNLGNALSDLGRLDEAIACYQRALKLNPTLAEAHNNLGHAWRDAGELDQAQACFRRAMQQKPDYAEAHSNLLCALQYAAEVTPAALAQAHAEWDRVFATSLRPDPRTPSPEPRAGQGRLRLGFVSPDLGRHPVGYFLVRVLKDLCRQSPERRPETICYSDRILQDDLTQRMQAAATLWREVAGLSDPQLAQQIRSDRVDILFDLAGHTAHNRLLALARRPAPIQVTWAGYTGTTGLAAMDYILADRFEIPPGAESYYRERVLRMPDGYVCYDPPDYAPPVTPLPALDRGAVTLGCFNNPAKITPQVIEVWVRILRRLPGARLALRFKGWDDRRVAGRYAALFAAQGIGPDRFELQGAVPHAELLAQYGRVDLALDPFPYSGGLTTCEALWMGVPVVTCPGETFASRHSLSHLSNVGLTETIARDPDEYVEIAVALAGDLPRLAAMRARLRPQMAASPLCDGPRFAANLLTLLHGIWQQRCGEAAEC